MKSAHIVLQCPLTRFSMGDLRPVKSNQAIGTVPTRNGNSIVSLMGQFCAAPSLAIDIISQAASVLLFQLEIDPDAFAVS